MRPARFEDPGTKSKTRSSLWILLPPYRPIHRRTETACIFSDAGGGFPGPIYWKYWTFSGHSEVERFFFWLSPNPQDEEISGWLEDNRLTPFKGTTYPTLIRTVEPVPPFQTPLDVRRVSRGEVEENRDAVVRIFDPWPSSFFFESIEQSGFEHFMAFEAGAPVSAAILACDGDFAYLGWAGTAEAHRKKGGQNALIRARLNRAAELGCRVACSETLAMLKTSLGNLQRNGFETVYHKKVYVWES